MFYLKIIGVGFNVRDERKHFCEVYEQRADVLRNQLKAIFGEALLR